MHCGCSLFISLFIFCYLEKIVQQLRTRRADISICVDLVEKNEGDDGISAYDDGRCIDLHYRLS